MSHGDLTRVIEQLASDAKFRAAFQNNPDEALAGYDLTAEEREVLLSGDSSQLQTLGLDRRVTKSAFKITGT